MPPIKDHFSLFKIGDRVKTFQFNITNYTIQPLFSIPENSKNSVKFSLKVNSQPILFNNYKQRIINLFNPLQNKPINNNLV